MLDQEAMPPLHLSYKRQSNRIPIAPTIELALLLLISLATTSSCCTEQEKASLLQFLAGLSQDGGLATTWKEATDCCKWEGITCNRNGTVTNVSLASKSLQGHISQSLGDLTGLQYLNLSYNSLSGSLPLELVLSPSIKTLDISYNHLSGDLHDLPSSTPGQPLQVLNISSNLFTGEFISTTWNGMENLIALNASNNSFTGKVPTHFCNMWPLLAVLEICHNKLGGPISPELGNCSRLRVLNAGYNNLNGSLPDELFNATSLEYLSFLRNSLQGKIDAIHIVKLRNLVILDLGENKFSGKIPDSIGHLQRLQEIHLDYNNMSGELPSTLSNCTSLEVIDLKSNKFSGELSKVDFSKLTNLRIIDLMRNNLTGTIPESIYSCTNLTALRLSSNRFRGQLSPTIENLKSLVFLSIFNNNFTNITNALQILKRSEKLTTLLMGQNFRNEHIPEYATMDGFQNLQLLSIIECQLRGNIPHWLSMLKNLEMLVLYKNRLTGPIPEGISRLKFLFYLDLSDNNITGIIPPSLMQMQMLISKNTAAHFDPGILELPVYKGPALQYRGFSAFPTVLNLAGNKLTGEIPQEIGRLTVLRSLNLSYNSLSGQIPESIGNLTDLLVLDLSNNHFTGAIPTALNNLHFLSQFNVSNNDLEGPTPNGVQISTFPNSSFDGNPKLCGYIVFRSCSSAAALTVSSKHNKKVILAIALSVFFGTVIVLLLLGVFLIHKNRSARSGVLQAASLNNTEQPFVMVPHGKGEENKLTLTDIVDATNNFDKGNIIGCGGYGLVFKAELPDGSVLAIKKLNSEMCLMEREFMAEVEALSMAKHDNLVSLRGYYIQGDSRFLIYSFVENGSLDDWLHNRDDDASTFLDWPTRLKIAQGASRGLSYIHDLCKPHIVHRDIKSSNILLDKEFKAYVADFGLSRLMLPNKTHVTTELVGTLGYIPPEYGQGWVATLRGDVYSFGVVMFELLTGRRPIPVLSTSKELVPWVLEMRSQGGQIEVLDPILRGTGHEEQMLKMLEVACKCVNYNPCMRPSMMEVVSCLESIDAGLQMQNSVKS